MRQRMKSSFERLVKADHISELITDKFFFILKIAADQYANDDLISQWPTVSRRAAGRLPSSHVAWHSHSTSMCSNKAIENGSQTRCIVVQCQGISFVNYVQDVDSWKCEFISVWPHGGSRVDELAIFSIPASVLLEMTVKWMSFVNETDTSR